MKHIANQLQVAHYGLPAAGVICLSMLRPSFRQLCAQVFSIPKLLQNLGVFASEIQIGGVLQVGAPNYALLYRATSTIQSFLQTAHLFNGASFDLQGTEHIDSGLPQQIVHPETDFVPFDLSAYTDLWGFEYDFWQDLGAHPSLLASSE